MEKFSKLVIFLMVIAAVVFVLAGQRSGRSQDQSNSSTNKSSGSTTNKSDSSPRGFGGLKKPPPKPPAPPPEDQDFSKATWNLPTDADKTKNTVEATPESVAKGKELFLGQSGNCVFCHGETGAGNEENLPNLRRKPADISDKTRMSTLTDGEIFWKITLGIPGIMPGREKQLTEEERWHVVNYVRTLAQEKPMN
jgi:mono/diheme cytochrome c family protein